MNYFEQITAGCDENILLLLGRQSGSLHETTQKALFKRNVEIINLELSYECNRKCDYCPVSGSSRKNEQKMMGLELLGKICAELGEIRYENRISLNLYNEPLLDDVLEDKIRLIRDHLPFAHIGFKSNGDKLNANRLRKLSDAGCDYICVTLHPPPNRTESFEKISLRLKKIYLKLTGGELSTSDLSEKSSIQFRSHGVTIKVQWPNWRTIGSNRGGLLINHISKSFVRNQPCAKPFREFTVFYDGKVQPCCEAFHDDQINLVEVGDLREKSVFEVYAANKLSDFRRHLFDFSPKEGICASCNIVDYSNPDEASMRSEIIARVS
jgi:MoaA/NifB/PqqE/SkfB family radical SAM enzyme